MHSKTEENKISILGRSKLPKKCDYVAEKYSPLAYDLEETFKDDKDTLIEDKTTFQGPTKVLRRSNTEKNKTYEKNY